MEGKKGNYSGFKKAYYLLYIILPLVFVQGIIDPVMIPRQIVLTLFSALIVILILLYKIKLDLRFLKQLLPIAISLLVLIYGISIIVSINKAESFYVLSKYSIIFIFYILTTSLLVINKIDVNEIIKGIIIFNIIIVVIGVYQIADLILSGQNFWGNVDSIRSSISNKNLLSSALFLTFPFLISSYRLSKIWRNISLAFLISSLVILLLIQARAVWVSMIAFTIILWLFDINSHKYQVSSIKKKNNTFQNFQSEGGVWRHRHKVNLYILSGFSVLIILVGLFKWEQKYLGSENETNWKESSFSHIDNTRSIEARKLTWGKSIEMIMEHPFTGVGGGNWKVVLPKYTLEGYRKGVQNGKMSLERPHNDFLWVCCETGVFGLLAFVAIFVLACFNGIHIVNTNRQSVCRLSVDAQPNKGKDNEDTMIYVYLLAGLAGYMIISFFDFPFERIEHTVIVMTILAIITHDKLGMRNEELGIKKIKVNFIIVPIIIIVIMFSWVVSYYRYEGLMHTQKMYDAKQERRWQDEIDEAKQSESMFYNIDPMGMPVSWYEGVAYSSMNMNEDAKLSFEKSYEVSPYNILVLSNLASIYENQQNHVKAIKYYTEAVRIAPKFEDGLLNLSAAYYNNNEFEKAYETIRKVKINTTNKNYSVFLDVILQKKIEQIIHKQTDRDVIYKLKELENDKKRLYEIYMDSKIRNIDFEKLILK